MEKPSFKLEQFEGPLDLLLYLIAKHKLDILDIEISVLLEQYLDYIRQMQENDMEIASEFLEMASRLVYMKTVSLLPRHEEEREQLQRELTGQLLEYEMCRRMAGLLGEEYRGSQIFVRAPMEVEADVTYRLTHDIRELMEAYLSAIGRAGRRMPPPADAFRPIVSRRMVSVNSRIIFLLKQLYRRNQVDMDEVFCQCGDRSELVATFLAVLELVKGKRILVTDGRSLVFVRERAPALQGEGDGF